MRRLLLMLCLATGFGCSTTRDKAEWADAMKDLRGENMQMRSGSGSGISEDWDAKPASKMRD